ncbi:MAG TPA: hypothetical protein VJ600_10435 [Holophagaceae bacterium]|nr:hypothetical protein [Holophagaceae bacterium]
MTTDLSLPEACRLALEAIQADPLEPGPAAEAHCRGCAPCREARVMLLAQEEEALPLVPAGYFERLPDRILRKLPAPSRRLPAWVWAAAAALLVGAVGVGGFLAGRANQVQTPAVAHQQEPEITAPLPFHDEDTPDPQSLSPEEQAALVKQLQATRDR